MNLVQKEENGGSSATVKTTPRNNPFPASMASASDGAVGGDQRERCLGVFHSGQ